MTEKDYKNILQDTSFSWGSYQYDETAIQYALLCEREKVGGRDNVLIDFGLHVGPAVPFEGDLLVSFKETVCIDLVDTEIEGADDATFREMLKNVKTVTDALHFLRSQAWDLWCGVPYMTKFVFPGFDLGKVCHQHEIGVLCWLLKSYGYVENDTPFKKWDT